MKFKSLGGSSQGSWNCYTTAPTFSPTKSPTQAPSIAPTFSPTMAPTMTPCNLNNCYECVGPFCKVIETNCASIGLPSSTPIPTVTQQMFDVVGSYLHTTLYSLIGEVPTVGAEFLFLKIDTPQNIIVSLLELVSNTTEFSQNSNNSYINLVKFTDQDPIYEGGYIYYVFINDENISSTMVINPTIIGDEVAELYKLKTNPNIPNKIDITCLTQSPTMAPSIAPSIAPTQAPTWAPTWAPVTMAPSIAPTFSPTKSPTQAPTWAPTWAPVTMAPSIAPTFSPTKSPTQAPTWAPVTMAPSIAPTFSPTKSPTQAPVTMAPTFSPTKSPTQAPTWAPVTMAPSIAPTFSQHSSAVI